MHIFDVRLEAFRLPDRICFLEALCNRVFDLRVLYSILLFDVIHLGE